MFYSMAVGAFLSGTSDNTALSDVPKVSDSAIHDRHFWQEKERFGDH
jgi:hypothetical protein